MTARPPTGVVSDAPRDEAQHGRGDGAGAAEAGDARQGHARTSAPPGTGYRVQGSGCRVQGSGCRVQVAGCRVQGSGYRVQGAGFRVQGAGCRVQGAGCRVQGAGFRVQGAGFRVQGAGFRVQLQLHPEAGSSWLFRPKASHFGGFDPPHTHFLWIAEVPQA